MRDGELPTIDECTTYCDSDASFDSIYLSIACPQRFKAPANNIATKCEIIRRIPRAAEEQTWVTKALYEHWEQSMKMIIHSHDYIWRACARCAVKREKMKKCSGCRLVHYCSTRCQHRAWAEHKLTCTPDGPLPKRHNYIRLPMSGQPHFPSPMTTGSLATSSTLPMTTGSLATSSTRRREDDNWSHVGDCDLDSTFKWDDVE